VSGIWCRDWLNCCCLMEVSCSSWVDRVMKFAQTYLLHLWMNRKYRFWCFSDRASLYGLISFTNFNAQFLYSLTLCILHYNPRHVSSINMPIFRRTNCIITASGIVTLCKRLYSKQSALIRHTVQPFTKNDDTRCCDNTICPPEDGHVNAWNMSRIVM
jgi:hypothetical protein